MERSTSDTASGQAPRLRVAVVGCGLVAQVMHLHYLRELQEKFEVNVLCDLSEQALRAAGRMFPGARRVTRWQDGLSEPLDAVLVLTPGSHEPVIVGALEAGLHVFAEKPLCFSVDEARRIIATVDRTGGRLMVGYMKRYDPAYEELATRLRPEGLRFARVTTLESPLEPYVAHYPLARGGLEADVLAELLADDVSRVTAAIGEDPVVRRIYRSVLLDSMVHELNAVRGLLGEPTELRFVHLSGDPLSVTALLAFGGVECTFIWIDLPGIARYEQELAFYADEERATLRFPSPFLRSMPTQLVLEGGDPGTASSWQTVRTISYEEAFKRELQEFHSCIVEGREAKTAGRDAVHDIALCESIVRSFVDGTALASPSLVEEVASRAVH